MTSEQQLYLIHHPRPRGGVDTGPHLESDFGLQPPEPNPVNGYFKIGVSNDPRGRCNRLNGGSPWPLTIYTTAEVEGDPTEVEHALHRALYYFGLRGEWFQVPEDVVEMLQDFDVVGLGEVEHIRETLLQPQTEEVP